MYFFFCSQTQYNNASGLSKTNLLKSSLSLTNSPIKLTFPWKQYVMTWVSGYEIISTYYISIMTVYKITQTIIF